MHPRRVLILALTAASVHAGQPETRDAAPAGPAAAPRNIIIFVADGAGESTHRALEYWAGSPPLYHSVEGADAWDRHTVTTYALRADVRTRRGQDPLAQDPALVFDPALAYDATPVEGELAGYPLHIAGYRWLRATAPDSANTATALFTGVSTYKGGINVDGAGQPVRSLGQAAAAQGMAVGVVSSVPASHATPACAGGASVPARSMYHEISRQLLTNGVCTVIAGAGHPFRDDDARPRTEPDFKFIGQTEWDQLAAGAIAAPDQPAWTLVDDPEQIRSLAQGDVPERLYIMAPAAQTLQQRREPYALGDETAPGQHPPTDGMPTLLDLSLAALNAVDDDPDGFVLVIEGGAVDWAMHDNQTGRMIEEMAEFHETVKTFSGFLDTGERGFDWSDTLVLVTSDHDHLLLGPDSDTVPFQPIQSRGQGQLPAHRWHADNHSNLPIPLYVRGRGAPEFRHIPTTSYDAPDGQINAFHQARIGRTLLELLAARSQSIAPGLGAAAK